MQEAFSLANLERSHDLCSRGELSLAQRSLPGLRDDHPSSFPEGVSPLGSGRAPKVQCNKHAGVWHTSVPEGLLDLQSSTAARRVSLCDRGDSQRVTHGGAEPRSTAATIKLGEAC